MNQNKDKLKTLDVLSKRGVTTSISKSNKRARSFNESIVSKDESDIEVLDEKADIICESDISIVESKNDQVLDEKADIIGEPDISIVESKNDNGLDEKADIICEPEISILKSKDFNCSVNDRNAKEEIAVEPDVETVEEDETIFKNNVNIENMDTVVTVEPDEIIVDNRVIMDKKVANTSESDIGKVVSDDIIFESEAKDIEVIVEKYDVQNMKSHTMVASAQKITNKENDIPEIINLESNKKKNVTKDNSIDCETSKEIEYESGLIDLIDLEPNSKKKESKDNGDEPDIICEPDFILDEVELKKFR